MSITALLQNVQYNNYSGGIKSNVLYSLIHCFLFKATNTLKSITSEELVIKKSKYYYTNKYLFLSNTAYPYFFFNLKEIQELEHKANSHDYDSGGYSSTFHTQLFNQIKSGNVIEYNLATEEQKQSFDLAQKLNNDLVLLRNYFNSIYNLIENNEVFTSASLHNQASLIYLFSDIDFKFNSSPLPVELMDFALSVKSSIESSKKIIFPKYFMDNLNTIAFTHNLTSIDT